ncbi:restriction endonuclease [Streptomyces sp. NRRL S-340]|uniref:restriction endonuclease n=1 Tax=Streptomyces sp. NRRL S-340 TaxID=1463901 RepID=UPI0007C5BCAF|nr:restriction endonuclease [Streptomyces sp. NRRL S-340]
MTQPVSRIPRVRRDRRFDLRTTALFFLLLAILLCVFAFLVRLLLGVVERRPLWAGELALAGTVAVVLFRSRWRRFSAARCARRAARALEEAAERASDSLGETTAEEAAPPPAGGGAPAAPDVAAEPARTARGGTQGIAGAAPTQAVAFAPHPDEEARTVPLDQVAVHAALDPDGFEQAVADLCARDACREAEVVGGAGDLGADVTALAPDGRRVVIQCKHYEEANKVGSQDLQRFGGTCFTIHEADVAAVVTTSDFTAPALEYARQCGIICVNGRDLRAWCDGTGPAPWEWTGVELPDGR